MGDDRESKKSPGESFADMFKEFGSAMSEIFNDPKLKEKAREFGESAAASAKVFASRFKDEDVKNKFKDVGKAAKDFGEGVADYFRDDKEKSQNKSGTDTTAGSGTAASDSGTAAQDSGTAPEDESKKKLIEPAPENQPDKKYDKDLESGTRDNRSARITGYSIAIAWGFILIVFFNFYSKYIAIYRYDELTKSWDLTPVLTSSFAAWLPILTISLAVSILGNIVLIINDTFYVSNITNIVMNIFGIASVSTLLMLFPFDFSAYTAADLNGILYPIITVVLILVIVGLGIGIFVRFIKIIVRIARSS